MTAPNTKSASITAEVAFHDVDALGVVWHGHFYKYFELARTALLRTRQLDVNDLAAFGVRVVVVESRCRYLRALRYGDVFTVTATLAETSPRVLIRYSIRAHDGTAVARGHTSLVALGDDGTMLTEVPDAIVSRLVR